MRDPKATVPPADSARNSEFRDVIGNKQDVATSGSIYALAIKAAGHLQGKVYPTLADGVVVTAGAAWVLGAFVEIVPVNTITSLFDVHAISVEDISANDVYEVVLYAAEVEICRARFTKNANFDSVQNVPVMMAVQPANTQIKAKIASSTGADTATISLMYHTYP